jgi:hypothetical protein
VLAKAGQDEFAILFDLLVGKSAERIEKYSCGVFVGFFFGKGKLKFGPLSCLAVPYGGGMASFQGKMPIFAAYR